MKIFSVSVCLILFVWIASHGLFHIPYMIMSFLGMARCEVDWNNIQLSAEYRRTSLANEIMYRMKKQYGFTALRATVALVCGLPCMILFTILSKIESSLSQKVQ